MNRLLIAHLRGDDFFAVDRFPSAELTVRQSRAIAGATPGQANLEVTADLALRGETHAVEFAVVAAARDDGTLVAQGTIAFDRTRWGSIYGSGRFFARLGKHVVNDLIDLQVKVVATPA
jgi:polyisoprenoid-binding protein YceI